MKAIQLKSLFSFRRRYLLLRAGNQEEEHHHVLPHSTVFLFEGL
jgi:hypothetical protein